MRVSSQGVVLLSASAFSLGVLLNIRSLAKDHLPSEHKSIHLSTQSQNDSELDFAIIGHPKTATTALTYWLGNHPEVQMNSSEIHFLTKHHPLQMINYLRSLPRDGLKGYKAPRDVADPRTLDVLAKYWPRAKLIVGLRHPVEYLESFYNYRVHEGHKMPPAEKLIGECLWTMSSREQRRERKILLNGSGDYGVCTDQARFHVHLSFLGKSNVSNPEEQALLAYRDYRFAYRGPMTNEVFLYESSQLSDSNVERFATFKRDLQHFLSLRTPLVSPPPRNSSDANYDPSRKNPLDICEPKYSDLRAELIRIGTLASTWIRTFFLDLPEVTVSSPGHFSDILLAWHHDPCNDVS